MPPVLTIAGSDSSCGAGIQADIKTFQRFGVYGMCAVTAVTAQGRGGVRCIMRVPAKLVSAQIECAAATARVGAVKTGMLYGAETVRAVCRSLSRHQLRPIVVDPVISSHEGRRLQTVGALREMIRSLFPMADLVTPNMHEAERMSGMRIRGKRDLLEAARALMKDGARAVLIKGCRGDGIITDWYYDGGKLLAFSGRLIRGKSMHGGGCILSAAIAACLARGLSMEDAIRSAKRYVSREIGRAIRTGGGRALASHI